MIDDENWPITLTVFWVAIVLGAMAGTFTFQYAQMELRAKLNALESTCRNISVEK